VLAEDPKDAERTVETYISDWGNEENYHEVIGTCDKAGTFTWFAGDAEDIITFEAIDQLVKNDMNVFIGMNEEEAYALALKVTRYGWCNLTPQECYRLSTHADYLSHREEATEFDILTWSEYMQGEYAKFGVTNIDYGDPEERQEYLVTVSVHS
jgi:hypothetical protein